MRAFVFSGGANRGALQAGATLALLDRGITPDLIVGSSVGAINGATLAAQPTIDGVRKIAERWKTVSCDDIFPGNQATSAWRLLRGLGSLHDNRNMRRFILGLLPANTRRFSDLPIPLYVTSTRLSTGEMHLFGHNPRERLIDAIMASAAVPPFLPPYRYRDEAYIDGCFVSNLPISVAIELGATEVWALEIGNLALSLPTMIGVRDVLSRSIETLVRHQMAREREVAIQAQPKGVTVHHIQMLHYSGLDCHDFRHSAQLMELGYASASCYIDEGHQLPTANIPTEIPRRARLGQAMRQSLELQRNRLGNRAEQLWQSVATIGRAEPVAIPVDND